jgi:hypothetical protein
MTEMPMYGDQHEVDRARHVVARVLGLLGHVRDGLDAGVREHRDRQREDQLRQARRGAEVHLMDQQRGIEHEHRTEQDHQDLRAEVGDGEHEVHPRRLTETADVEHHQQRQHDERGDDVARRVVQCVQPG